MHEQKRKFRSQLLPVGTTHAIIDDSDYKRATIYKWWYDKTAIAMIGGKRTSLPRYLLSVPAGKKVFWRNGDKMDCRRSNLTTERWLSEKKAKEMLRAEISRHMRMVVDMGETVASGKLRDRITRAKIVMATGDRKEIINMTKIMGRIKK